MGTPHFHVPDPSGLFLPTKAIHAAADGTPDRAIHSIFAVDKHRFPDLASARAAGMVKNMGRPHPNGPPLRSDLGGKSPLPPHTLYRQDLVHEAVRGILRGDIHPEETDPVHLYQTQSGVTLPGVRHYTEHRDYWRTGDTFADQNQSGNKVPIIYERTAPQGHRERHILSGHHRAAAALGLGVPLMAHVIQAP